LPPPLPPLRLLLLLLLLSVLGFDCCELLDCEAEARQTENNLERTSKQSHREASVTKRISIINFVGGGRVNLFILVLVAAVTPPSGVQFLIVIATVVTSAATVDLRMVAICRKPGANGVRPLLQNDHSTFDI
jgi:hypothetical protein